MSKGYALILVLILLVLFVFGAVQCDVSLAKKRATAVQPTPTANPMQRTINGQEINDFYNTSTARRNLRLVCMADLVGGSAIRRTAHDREGSRTGATADVARAR